MRGEIWNFVFRGHIVSVYQPPGGGYADPRVQVGTKFASDADRTFTHPTISTDRPVHDIGKFSIDLRDYVPL